jgi:hypothetical protein
MENKNLNSEVLMGMVKESYSKTRKLKKEIGIIEKDMMVKSFMILDELKKIEGWEELIDECKGHYEQYPDEFFGWCEPVVLGTTENPELAFRKGYSDGSDYFVMRLDLNKPLSEQVEERLESIRKRELEKDDKKRKKEYNEYMRLKKKFEKDEG